LKLNHERYAEEVARGLHEKGAKARAKSKNNGKGSAKGKNMRDKMAQEEFIFE